VVDCCFHAGQTFPVNPNRWLNPVASRERLG
jgi:hypothetical protein